MARMAAIDPIFGWAVSIVAAFVMIVALITREYLIALLAFSVAGMAARQELLVEESELEFEV